MGGYITKIYGDQGGDRQVIASGGTILVQAGGTIDMTTGAKVLFNGAQQSGAAQAAVAVTAATNVTPFGYSQAQADALVTLVNALRTALVNAGIIKGAA